MPIPSRRASESKDEFISRCISDSKMRSEFPDSKQRAAVCYSNFKKNFKKPLFDNIYNSNKNK